MTDKHNTIVRFDYSMMATCPHCQEELDLVYQDDDCVYSESIFSNKWDDLKGEEVYCNNCDNVFLIQEVEY